MLGFSSISETPLSSLSSVVFYIRGASDIAIVVTSGDGQGRLDIFGNAVNIIDIGTSSIGYIKIARRRKQFIAQAVYNTISGVGSNPQLRSEQTQKSTSSSSTSQSITPESTQNTIDSSSTTRRIKL